MARERQNVFDEMKEMGKHILSSIDTEGIIAVLAWSACDREGRRRFVAVEREKMTLVAYMYAMVRARQEEESSERTLHRKECVTT